MVNTRLCMPPEIAEYYRLRGCPEALLLTEFQTLLDCGEDTVVKARLCKPPEIAEFHKVGEMRYPSQIQ